MFQATTVRPPQTAPDDPRIGHLLGREVATPVTAKAVILGFPSDEGVRRNGGRPGAAQAPDAIRNALYRFTPDARCYPAFVDILEHTLDLGNLVVDGEMEANQQRLGEALKPLLKAGVVPIILGGGHETSFGHFLGYVEARQSIAILNWDAHADVRPLREERGHSGSPFRQALEHASGLCQGYTVAGVLPHSFSRSHAAYMEQQGARYIWSDELSGQAVKTLYEVEERRLMITFDIDAVRQECAPGVSAPAVYGMPQRVWLEAAYQAGRCPRVTSVDLVEMNPEHDVDRRTARLAALTIWFVLKGLAEREPEHE